MFACRPRLALHCKCWLRFIRSKARHPRTCAAKFSRRKYVAVLEITYRTKKYEDCPQVSTAGIQWHTSEEEITASSTQFSSMAKASEGVRPEVWPHVSPKFPISSGASIYKIGSYFSRNIEDNLSELGYNLPALEFQLPNNENDCNLLITTSPISLARTFTNSDVIVANA